MGIRRGSISTPIIADGLVLNMDAANRASYPAQRTFATAESGSCYNTLDLSQSGSFISDPEFITQPVSASSWVFDGVDDCIITSGLDSMGMGTTKLITVSAWFKTDTTNDFPVIINTGNWPFTSGVIIYLNSTSEDIGARVNNETIVSSGTNYRDNAWHYALVRYDGNLSSDNIEFFVDGVSINTANLTSDLTSTTFDIHIGINHPSTGTQRPWGGLISNAQIYNRGLSTNEVLHNYNALKGRFSS